MAPRSTRSPRLRSPDRSPVPAHCARGGRRRRPRRRRHRPALDYFSRIANAQSEDSPSAPHAQIVANAFVALGRYYLSGIPNTKVKPDQERAREMFSYAASYFGNADAQYDLARLYLKTPDASREDFRYGARWLGLAAQKGQHQAQAMLGQMLFAGDRLPREAARGPVWLAP